MYDDNTRELMSREVDSPTGGGVESTKRRAFIYFVQCNGPGGPIKIGRATSIDRRLSVLQSSCPYGMDLIGHVLVEDAEADERRLHLHFAGYLIHGEWFRCCDEILAQARAANEARIAALSARFRSIAKAAVDADDQTNP